MARRLLTQTIDDLDGNVLEDGEGETIIFGVNGVGYQIDLTDKNAKEFRKKLDYYIKHSRRVGGGKEVRKTTATKQSSIPRDPLQTKHIREWANANGFGLGNRGRIPREVLVAYDTSN